MPLPFLFYRLDFQIHTCVLIWSVYRTPLPSIICIIKWKYYQILVHKLDTAIWTCVMDLYYEIPLLFLVFLVLVPFLVVIAFIHRKMGNPFPFFFGNFHIFMYYDEGWTIRFFTPKFLEISTLFPQFKSMYLAMTSTWKSV